MFIIQQITTDSVQKRTLILADGTTLDLSIVFVPMQYGWFITELVWTTFTLNNLRITNSPNMLHQFKNKLPFGLACFSKDSREPSQQQDFSSETSKLYILTSEEVQQYAEFLSGKV